MPTIDQIASDVRVNLNNPTTTEVSDATIYAAINAAINVLEMENPWFQVEETSFALTVGQPNITSSLPTDFISELPYGGITLEYSDQRIPLTKIDLGQYDEWDDKSNGTPRWYTVKDNTIHLLPYPDTADTLYVRYYKSYSDLSSSESNDFTNDGVFARVVKFITSADLWYDLKKDAKKYAVYMTRAGINPDTGAHLSGGLMSRLKRITNQKRGGNRITPSGVLPVAC